MVERSRWSSFYYVILDVCNYLQLRNLLHEHIVRFIGMCLEPEHQCVIYEYCKKGSLENILAKDTINLDWAFRYSIISESIEVEFPMSSIYIIMQSNINRNYILPNDMRHQIILFPWHTILLHASSYSVDWIINYHILWLNRVWFFCIRPSSNPTVDCAVTIFWSTVGW